MALSIKTQDIENFPGTTKTVSVDLGTITSTDSEGDESYVLSVATSAYSKINSGQRLQDLYITGLASGWAKSSGLTGISGKYFIDSTHNTLRIKLDTTISGVDGTGFYPVMLTYNEDDTPIDGDSVAADLENKLHALADNLEVADVGFSNSYRNSVVEYKNGKFWIISGSIGKYYTGGNRSSVVVEPAFENDCTQELGFDLGTSSIKLSSTTVRETLLNSDFTVGSSALSVNTGTGGKPGLAYMITDGINTEYFVTISGTSDSVLKIATEAEHGYSALQNNYTAYETKLQLLKEQDPDTYPRMWYDSVDALIRYGIKTMINQIDYSN